jgi:large subunit ribosomal protein L24
MSKSKIKIKKGDTVIVLAGKDSGKKGKVLEVFPKDASLIVERVNVVKRHLRANRNFQGGIIEKAVQIPIAKVMLVCPRCSEPSRVKSSEIENKKVRACVRCGEIIDKVK